MADVARRFLLSPRVHEGMENQARADTQLEMTRRYFLQVLSFSSFIRNVSTSQIYLVGSFESGHVK